MEKGGRAESGDSNERLHPSPGKAPPAPDPHPRGRLDPGAPCWTLVSVSPARWHSWAEALEIRRARAAQLSTQSDLVHWPFLETGRSDAVVEILVIPGSRGLEYLGLIQFHHHQ